MGTLRDIINETVPEGDPAQFLITVTPSPNLEKAEVKVEPSVHKDTHEEPPFIYWMALAEYLLHLVATKSDAPYEEAMHSLVRGAETWRDL